MCLLFALPAPRNARASWRLASSVSPTPPLVALTEAHDKKCTRRGLKSTSTTRDGQLPRERKLSSSSSTLSFVRLVPVPFFGTSCTQAPKRRAAALRLSQPPHWCFFALPSCPPPTGQSPDRLLRSRRLGAGQRSRVANVAHGTSNAPGGGGGCGWCCWGAGACCWPHSGRRMEQARGCCCATVAQCAAVGARHCVRLSLCARVSCALSNGTRLACAAQRERHNICAPGPQFAQTVLIQTFASKQDESNLIESTFSTGHNLDLLPTTKHKCKQLTTSTSTSTSTTTTTASRSKSEEQNGCTREPVGRLNIGRLPATATEAAQQQEAPANGHQVQDTLQVDVQANGEQQSARLHQSNQQSDSN